MQEKIREGLDRQYEQEERRLQLYLRQIQNEERRTELEKEKLLVFKAIADGLEKIFKSQE